MPDIVLQDLYGTEQIHENLTEFALNKADGSGLAWYIDRPMAYFVLRETDYEPPEKGVIATGGVGPMFGGGEINLLMMSYAPVEGVSEHAVIVMAHTLNQVQTGYYYVYETLTGPELLAAIGNSSDTCEGTAQPGWNILENVDGTDTLRHIDDPSSVSIPIPHPYTIIDEVLFYSVLAPAGQEKKEVTLTENGTVAINPEPGSTGLQSVQVTVAVEDEPAVLQAKTVTITENGTVEITPDEGWDGLSSVALTVEIEGGGETVANAITAADVTAMLASAGVIEPVAVEDNLLLTDSEDDIYIL